LEVSFFVMVSTSRPSPELSLLPAAGGDFQLGPFYAAARGFSCYYLEIIGSWIAKGPDLAASGPIRSALVDGGKIGADATTRIDPAGHPNFMTLKGFAWHGNSGGAVIPDLVSARVDGVAIELSPTYISFPGVKAADLALASSLAAK
jgi:hypothetical protein